MSYVLSDVEWKLYNQLHTKFTNPFESNRQIIDRATWIERMEHCSASWKLTSEQRDKFLTYFMEDFAKTYTK